MATPYRGLVGFRFSWFGIGLGCGLAAIVRASRHASVVVQKMKCHCIAAIWFVGILLGSVSLAELEEGYFDQPLCVFEFPDDEEIERFAIRVPIVVTVLDSEGAPIEGAAVALMRLGAGGYTAKDVLRRTNPRTDVSGAALLYYPVLQSGRKLYDVTTTHFTLIGAITAVHPDGGIGSVELAQLYKQPLPLAGATTTPWITIRLGVKAKTNKAQQDSGGDP